MYYVEPLIASLHITFCLLGSVFTSYWFYLNNLTLLNLSIFYVDHASQLLSVFLIWLYCVKSIKKERVKFFAIRFAFIMVWIRFIFLDLEPELHIQAKLKCLNFEVCHQLCLWIYMCSIKCRVVTLLKLGICWTLHTFFFSPLELLPNVCFHNIKST